MKYLIVGRSGTGKDTLANFLVAKGLRMLKSYTTRPRRYEGEDTHEFITPEEATKKTHKVATTVINGYEYFATQEQLDQCDIYIIDPHGLYELVENCPMTTFHIVHLTADPAILRERAINRADDKEHEAEVYDARVASEDSQFLEFETKLQNKEHIANNACIVYANQTLADKEDIDNFATMLVGGWRLAKNLKHIVNMCVDIGILSQEEIGKIVLVSEKGRASIPTEQFVDILTVDKVGFTAILQSYLSSTIIYDDTDETYEGDDVMAETTVDMPQVE